MSEEKFREDRRQCLMNARHWEDGEKSYFALNLCSLVKPLVDLIVCSHRAFTRKSEYCPSLCWCIVLTATLLPWPQLTLNLAFIFKSLSY